MLAKATYALRTVSAAAVLSAIAVATSPPVVLVTCADGPEGSVLTRRIIELRRGFSESGTGVLAGVASVYSKEARALQALGAELRTQTPSPEPGFFIGAQWVLLLAPLTADRLEVGRALIDAAVAGGVHGALLLSVVGSTAAAPASLQAYFDLERHLVQTWPTNSGYSYALLRTFFYQQNLLFWADDVRSTGALRVPLENTCFAPLYEADVADAAAALTASSQLSPKHTGKIFNLTGPQALDGVELVTLAARTLSQPGLRFEPANRSETFRLLQKTGRLNRSEAQLLVDLLTEQTSQPACRRWPSSDLKELIGHEATPVSRFFAENRAAFGPKASLWV